MISILSNSQINSPSVFYRIFIGFYSFSNRCLIDCWLFLHWFLLGFLVMSSRLILNFDSIPNWSFEWFSIFSSAFNSNSNDFLSGYRFPFDVWLLRNNLQLIPVSTDMFRTDSRLLFDYESNVFCLLCYFSCNRFVIGW